MVRSKTHKTFKAYHHHYHSHLSFAPKEQLEVAGCLNAQRIHTQLFQQNFQGQIS